MKKGLKTSSERVFVGIFLLPSTRRALIEWQKRLPPSLRIRWQEAKKLHMTLLFAGRRSPEELQRLAEVVRQTANRTPFATIHFKRHVAWFAHESGRGVRMMLAVPRERAFFSRLHQTLLEAFPVDEETRRFTPHCLLGKTTGEGKLVIPLLPDLSFCVSSLVIVFTERGPRHDRYLVWKRFPLQQLPL